MSSHIATAGGRPVPTRNLHVTVAFLGEVAERRLPDVLACAGRIADPQRFVVQFERVEVWTGPRVLCLTAAVVPPALLQLFERLRANLAADGFGLPRETYRPHVTLARHARGPYSAFIEPVGWPVREFVLAESRRDRAGSEYTVVARWPLADP